MSLKFGLNIKKKNLGAVGKPAPVKKKSLFDEDGNNDVNAKAKSTPLDGAEEITEFNFDETATSAPEPPKPKSSTKSKGKLPLPPSRPLRAKGDEPTFASSSLSEAEKKAQEVAAVDPDIFDYDAAYDALQASRISRKVAQEESQEHGPRYMNTLFESAEVRKMDRQRAKDKLIQREREAEGDEFADKAKFVTGAYKAHQEETRRAEEEEKKKQELEEKKRRDKGMQGFHRNMLREEEKRHQEAQAAMEGATQLAKKGLLPVIADEKKEKTEVELAEELNAKGKHVIINDDGEVADKRQLLNAGLNVVARPKTAATPTNASARASGAATGFQDRNPGRGAMRERQTAMIAQQIEQVAKRKADEDAEEQRKLEHTIKSRKTEGDINSAKERYLQRKREAAAAKAAAAGK